jgi:hypothetical protein
MTGEKNTSKRSHKKTNAKITFFILLKSASDFFPIMFYLPLSTSVTKKFDHGPSHAGVSKETNHIIDFLIS